MLMMESQYDNSEKPQIPRGRGRGRVSRVPVSEFRIFEPNTDRDRCKTQLPDEFISFGNDSDEYFSDDGVPESDSTPITYHTRVTGRNTRRRSWNFSYWKGQVKRKYDGVGPERKRKKTESTTPKTASMVLHEMCTDLVFTFSDFTGPPHDPLFFVTMVYPPNGKEYRGSGRSKKLAKHNLAENVLTDLGIPLPLPIEQQEVVFPNIQSANENELITSDPLLAQDSYITSNSENTLIDFTSDHLSTPTCGFNLTLQYGQDFYGSSNVLKRLRNIPNLSDNSASALNALLAPISPTYEIVSEEGPDHAKVFTAKIFWSDPSDVARSFIAKGHTKKKAKSIGARDALISMIGYQIFQILENRSRNLIGKSEIADLENDVLMTAYADENSDASQKELDVQFADYVANIVTAKFEDLLKADKLHETQKVLAGVVLTTGYPLTETARVIAVTTGTKCIEGGFMSERGLALNDCHAEILATRCARDFIYSELDKLVAERKSKSANMTEFEDKANIFDLLPESTNGVPNFKLKDDVKFHLYISTSPCGDARIFSPHGVELPDEEVEHFGDKLTDDHPNRINRGLLRAKIEAGEGTIPVANLNFGPQAWDAIIHGSALNTMSCSDKICRWNVVGFQGALLTNFVGPLYYSSITLGSLHHPIHFQRAVMSRVIGLESILAHPFKLNKPKLLMVSKDVKRRVKKSPNHAITWSSSWSSYEVLAASKGVSELGGVASKLSKRVLFLRFLKLYKNESGRRECFANLTYEDAKHLAVDYQKAKTELMTLMKNLGYGIWISKPVEIDWFQLD